MRPIFKNLLIHLLSLGLILTSFNSFAENLTAYKEFKQQDKAFKNSTAKTNRHKKSGNKGHKRWQHEEYSGEHSLKDIRMAVGSKAFSWLSGSPADNEKLSIGKTAQFFGFVALRYQSGRAAQRGALGRNFYNIASEQQGKIMRNAVLAEATIIQQWWQVRNQLLRQLEQYLYTGENWNEQNLLKIGEKFGYLNAELARIEMQAFADIENLLTQEQWQQLRSWRADPSLVASTKLNKPDVGLSRELNAQYEDLFAKAFSLLTGNFNDRKIIPLGQPAQFFGFVSIRHKSGHGASRGKISKQFYALLTSEQAGYLKEASQQLIAPTQAFMAVRTRLMHELDKLRHTSKQAFDAKQFTAIARELGAIETRSAMIEAKAYKKVRASMSETQVSKMMQIRADYVIDQRDVENTNIDKRGEQLYNLCQGCHNNQNEPIAPDLTGVIGRNIASVKQYKYSRALAEKSAQIWDEKTLDNFLMNPKRAIPGTKMEFTGLLNQQDRQALIDYLKKVKD